MVKREHVAARLRDERERIATEAAGAIAAAPRQRRSKKSARTRNWKKPGAGRRKAMAASEGSSTGSGGGRIGSGGAAR